MSAPPNRLLHGLPKIERDRIEDLYEPIELPVGEYICRAGETIHHAVFPHAGVISLVADVAEDAILELSLLGNEGMFGVPLALDSAISDVGGLVQAEGYATRIEAKAFIALLDDSPVLRARILRYARDLIGQISQTAICNTFHTIEERTARWVLTMADRTRSNEIRMTQSFLAGMLGVRRPAVSQAANAMLGDGLIDYSRGHLEIIDRAGLERAACACYRLTEKFYR